MVVQTSPPFVDVRRILQPRSIAVIGASEQPGNLGGETVRRLLKFKYPGRVSPVGRTAVTVAGLPCLASISELPEAPGSRHSGHSGSGLMAAIRECADFGVRHGIAYAGGLAEAGAEGAELQRALVALCRDNGFALCGPNCVGVINATGAGRGNLLHRPAGNRRTAPRSDLHGLPERRHRDDGLLHGAAGRIRHSLPREQRQRSGRRLRRLPLRLRAGCRHAIIGGYLEGIADGPKFVRALEEARAAAKPVVLIKAGHDRGHGARPRWRTPAALVGEDRVVDAILQGNGRDASPLGGGARRHRAAARGNEGKVASGPGVGVITFGGGNGVLGAGSMRAFGVGHAGA
jgi:acyl-CoA synthetase (NDP forming)